MELKIEKGVPLPKKRGMGLADALRRASVGDSFIWAGKCPSAHIEAKIQGKRVATQKQPDGTYRVWRIK